jgi:hypothetical protein
MMTTSELLSVLIRSDLGFSAGVVADGRTVFFGPACPRG